MFTQAQLSPFMLLLQSIYRLKKACHGELDAECNLLTPDQVVDRIFELVDENGDGIIYYDLLFFNTITKKLLKLWLFSFQSL